MPERVRPKLAVFVRAPVMGRAKTRLAAGLGAVEAMRVYRALLSVTLRSLARDSRWQTVLAVTPDALAHDAAAGRLLPTHLPRLPQGSGGLGERLARIFRALGPGPAVIVGSDIAGLGAADVALAFRALRHADAVLGPARDGGFWLIGFARAKLARALLAPIRWSSAHALEETVEALSPARVTLLRTLSDIDTAADYRAWQTRTKVGRRAP